MVEPSLLMRESMTLSSMEVHLGQRMMDGDSRTLVKFEEVLEDFHAALGGDALRVKLHAPDRQLAVAQAHDLTLGGFGGDFQFARESCALDEQRVIARRRE